VLSLQPLGQLHRQHTDIRKIQKYKQQTKSHGVVFFMCIFANCICLACIVILCVFVISYVYLLYLMCICCTLCVFVVLCVLCSFTLDAGLLARSQYPEGPATGHLDTGFSWFPCVYKRMLRWFPSFQVATTCLSCSPPDLNFLVAYFIFVYM
jgi:hypothetical protein